MQIFRTLAGYSLGRADIVRRAMSKKKHTVMEQERQIFIHGLVDESGKVVVEGINVATCHVKPKKQGEEGGIISREIPIYASKVMLVCPKCGKATRHAVKLADGKKARVCKKCGQEI